MDDLNRFVLLAVFQIILLLLCCGCDGEDSSGNNTEAVSASFGSFKTDAPIVSCRVEGEVHLADEEKKFMAAYYDPRGNNFYYGDFLSSAIYRYNFDSRRLDMIVETPGDYILNMTGGGDAIVATGNNNVFIIKDDIVQSFTNTFSAQSIARYEDKYYMSSRGPFSEGENFMLTIYDSEFRKIGGIIEKDELRPILDGFFVAHTGPRLILAERNSNLFYIINNDGAVISTEHKNPWFQKLNKHNRGVFKAKRDDIRDLKKDGLRRITKCIQQHGDSIYITTNWHHESWVLKSGLDLQEDMVVHIQNGWPCGIDFSNNRILCLTKKDDGSEGFAFVYPPKSFFKKE